MDNVLSGKGFPRPPPPNLGGFFIFRAMRCAAQPTTNRNQSNESGGKTLWNSSTAQ
jgi:hypothetical protein